jgi:hypothetical protein
VPGKITFFFNRALASTSRRKPSKLLLAQKETLEKIKKKSIPHGQSGRRRFARVLLRSSHFLVECYSQKNIIYLMKLPKEHFLALILFII